MGAAGTSLLVLLAGLVDDKRRAPAATIMWVLMIVGFAITSTLAGHVSWIRSPPRVSIEVVAAAAVIAFVSGAVCDLGHRERRIRRPPNRHQPSKSKDFKTALREVWADPVARRFTLFVFASMLAYSAQELLLEPFAGLVFAYSIGASAKLSGLQHSGVFWG